MDWELVGISSSNRRDEECVCHGDAFLWMRYILYYQVRSPITFRTSAVLVPRKCGWIRWMEIHIYIYIYGTYPSSIKEEEKEYPHPQYITNSSRGRCRRRLIYIFMIEHDPSMLFSFVDHNGRFTIPISTTITTLVGSSRRQCSKTDAIRHCRGHS